MIVEMKAGGCVLDIVNYNILIGGLCRECKFEEVVGFSFVILEPHTKNLLQH